MMLLAESVLLKGVSLLVEIDWQLAFEMGMGLVM